MHCCPTADNSCLPLVASLLLLRIHVADAMVDAGFVPYGTHSSLRKWIDQQIGEWWWNKKNTFESFRCSNEVGGADVRYWRPQGISEFEYTRRRESVDTTYSTVSSGHFGRHHGDRQTAQSQKVNKQLVLCINFWCHHHHSSPPSFLECLRPKPVGPNVASKHEEHLLLFAPLSRYAQPEKNINNWSSIQAFDSRPTQALLCQ